MIAGPLIGVGMAMMGVLCWPAIHDGYDLPRRVWLRVLGWGGLLLALCEGRELRITLTLAWWSGLAGLALISVLWSWSRTRASEVAQDWTAGLALGCAIASLQDPDPILSGVAWGVGMSSIVGIVQVLAPRLDLLPQAAPPGATWGNRNMAAEWTALGTALLLGDSRYWTSLVLALVFLALARCRAGLVALGTIGLLWWGSAIAWLLSGAIAIRELGRRIEHDTSIRERLALCVNSLPLLTAMGRGIGQWGVWYPTARGSLMADPDFTAYRQPQQAHCDPLQVLVELGPLGLALLAGWLGALPAAVLALTGPFLVLAFPLARAAPLALLAVAGATSGCPIACVQLGSAGIALASIALVASVAGGVRRIVAARELARAARADRLSVRIEHVGRAVRCAPGLLDAQILLGQSALVAGDLRLAERACRDALAIHPTHTSALSNLAAVLVRAGRGVEAEAMARRALEILPTHRGACYHRGELARAEGRLEEAQRWYERAMEVQEADCPASLHALVRIACERGDGQAAREYLERYRAFTIGDERARPRLLYLEALVTRCEGRS